MLVAFDILGIVSLGLVTLDTGPGVFSQQSGFTLGRIAMEGLSHAAVFARHDKVPGVGLTEGYRHWGNTARVLLGETTGQCACL